VITAFQVFVGIASLAIASHVFWRIGQEDGVDERWRRMPGMEVLIVAFVLGGWAAGASLTIIAILSMFSG
jgi:hypothetical protein